MGEGVPGPVRDELEVGQASGEPELLQRSRRGISQQRQQRADGLLGMTQQPRRLGLDDREDPLGVGVVGQLRGELGATMHHLDLRLSLLSVPV